MVYITGHTFTNRLTNAITAKVYANCDSVELLLNGASQGVRTSTNCIFSWPVALNSGSNFVQAVGTKGGVRVNDSLFWIAPLVRPSAASLKSGHLNGDFLQGTSGVLQLSATASDNQPNPPGPLVTSWAQVGGAGVVTFGTTQRADHHGDLQRKRHVYSLAFKASNGTTSTSAFLTVVVGNVRLARLSRRGFRF